MYNTPYSCYDTYNDDEGCLLMVIEKNMSPKAIVQVWQHTESIFVTFNIPLSDEPLHKLADEKTCAQLIETLNEQIGSSEQTCVPGG